MANDLPPEPGVHKEPMGPLVQPYLDARMRLPVALRPFVDGSGPLSAWEADMVRAHLRRLFAPPIPDIRSDTCFSTSA